jgi:hypothetical protein
MGKKERLAFSRLVFKAIVAGIPGKDAEEAAVALDRVFKEQDASDQEEAVLRGEVPSPVSSDDSGSTTSSSDTPLVSG